MSRRPCHSSMGWAMLVAALLLPPGLHAQSKETLGTRLEGGGNTLTFAWDPKHPWAAQMNGSGVQLFAEYQTYQQGRVIEKLDTAKPTGTNLHEVALQLPGTLQGVPQGNVCLFLQVPGGKRIPLRRPSASVPDTDHFALPAWSAVVSGNTQTRSHQSRVQVLQAAISSSQAGISALETELADKGWQGEASCADAKLPAGAFSPTQRPRDVLPAEQHESEAELVCMRRVLHMRSLALEQMQAGNSYGPRNIARMLPEPATDALLLQYLHAQKGVDTEDLRRREAEFARYKAVWQRWASTASDQNARHVTPSYGRIDDNLLVQDVSGLVGWEILDYSHPDAPTLKLTRHPATRDVAGYLGGGLETFSRCVVDGQKELAAKLRAWQEQVERAPKLESMAKGQLRTQCLSNFADLAKKRQELSALKQQLATEENFQPAAVQTIASSNDTALNSISCTVP